jgi:predicted nucleic acid-binding protein
MKRVAYRVYLDTNVFVFGRTLEKSNSKIILDLAKTGVINVIISDVLISEVRNVFARLHGRDAAKYAQFYVESFSRSRRISTLEIAGERRKYASFVKKEDLDHLTAAKIGEVNYFITTDSDFRESGAKSVVKILTPKEFVNLVGIEAYETPHGE